MDINVHADNKRFIVGRARPVLESFLNCTITLCVSVSALIPRSLERYSRQVVLPQIGLEGQSRLRESTVAIVGLGALGSVSSTLLVRAGVGRLILVDRDFIELSNLQRQIVYDEEDIEKGLPKAIACAEKLRKVNSDVEIVPVVDDVNHTNIDSILGDADVILDGTDNFETRLLLNDYSLKAGIPWIYAAAISTHGMTMNIVPGETPCFRCLVDKPPPPGTTPTCETAGILNTIAAIIASMQVTECIKMLMGKDYLKGELLVYDAWLQKLHVVRISRREDCPACSLGSYEYLEGRAVSRSVVLCGQNSVQVMPKDRVSIDLSELSEKLKPLGEVKLTRHFLSFKYDKYEIVVFPNGRAIIKGTSDPSLARSLYSRFVGA